MPVLICLREKVWTRTYYIGEQVPTCPVFTRAKIKSRFGILVISRHTFFQWLPLYYCLSFSCSQIEGNNKTGKTKASAFSIQDYNGSKNIFAFLWLFLFHPLAVMSCLSFSNPKFESNKKKHTHRRLKSWSCLTIMRTHAKIFLFFYNSLSPSQSYVLSLILPTQRQ